MLKRLISLTLFCTVLFFAFSFNRKTEVTPYKFPELFHFPKMPISLANPVSVEGAKLGRYLFYDTILSANYNLSCGSCHKQENAFSDAPNSFSKGNNSELMKRNTPALYNLAWYPSFFWDGKASSIEEQILHPVRTHTEMNLSWLEAAKRIKQSKFYKTQFKLVFGKKEIDSTLITKAIGQFLRTLLSYQSKYDRMLRGIEPLNHEEHEGYVIVNDQTMGDCLHCHPTDASALATTLAYSNNGLDLALQPENFKDKGLGGITGKVKDFGKFKIPSLRNIAITAPYMHDGRFKTLEEVVDFYSEGVNVCANIDSKMQYAHQRGVKLNSKEKKQVVAFLKTLTDSAFISNPAFSNPFRVKQKK
jgi:cytochrome c peroxidase